MAWVFESSSFTAPLHLRDDRVFTVGGREIHTDHPGTSPITGSPGPGWFAVDHMYVHARVPVEVSGPPLVLVHGATGTGASFETTPDGREGWATWFARRGFPVFVVDHAGRGRSGFDPTPVNAARAGEDVDLPNVFLGTKERLWVNTRVGPRYGEPFAGTRFPVGAFDRFAAFHVPNTETTLARGGETSIDDLVLLLEQIGPAVLIGHSQAGLYTLEVARRATRLVRAVVGIEGGARSVTADDARRHFTETPFLTVWGDHSEGAAGVNGDERRMGCLSAVGHIRASGGDAEALMLPALGVEGNSHAMMIDDNNLEVAALVEAWIRARS